MRLEGHHGCFQSQPGGGSAHAGQQGLMAEVDAVEIADRERAGRTRRCIGKTSKYLHGNLGKTCRKYEIIRGIPQSEKKALSGGAGTALGAFTCPNYIGWLMFRVQ